ncbi:MAG: class I SAM-dependent methyltransferase [Sulfitobacter sp.]
MTDDKTLKVYANKVADYVKVTQNSASRDPLLHAFLAALPAQGHVLDLGCGPGHIAAEMAAVGHRVTATDAVAEMVAVANAHSGVEATVATFDEIAGTDIYDGIWANFSLLHAPRADMPRHLKALHQAIKPGGRFHIALKSGESSQRDTLGRLYTYYSDAELTELVEHAGFTVTDRAAGADTGLDGQVAEWIALVAHG